MDFQQLQKIGQLDQLKKDGTLSQEEYDRARERVLAKPTPEPQQLSSANAKAPSIGSIGGYIALGAIFFITIVLFLNRDSLNRRYESSTKGSSPTALDSVSVADDQDKPLSAGIGASDEAAFNPDIQQNGYMLLIKNRNPFPYEGCELTINDRFKTKVTNVKPNGQYIVANQMLADDEGAIYNPATTRVMELEFYCKNYNGHSDIISLERP